MIALSQGYLLSSIVLASTMVHIIEREFLRASLWMVIAAILSFLGAIHSFVITDNSVASQFGVLPGGLHGYAVQYGTVYLGVAILFVLFFIREKDISFSMLKERMVKMCSVGRTRSPLVGRTSPLLFKNSKRRLSSSRLVNDL